MESEVIPSRMFAVGHEPIGIRVTAYHKSRGLSAVINALEEDEVEFLRQSPFGKFIGTMDKPLLSGRFVRFIMSRQLKVNKLHEIWILFAGKPIRVSLREFAIVTGLPCGEYPKKSKRKLKHIISENSNWSVLFGTLKQVSVKTVIKMLRNKTVTDKETRIKYACLALLDSVLLPTTHNHKIDHSHVEAIKDIDDFFAYPWGRVAFEMMMTSIKERDEVALSQNTIIIRGFVHALQLIMVEAVPALTEAVQVNSFSSSESEDEDEDDDGYSAKESPLVKVSLSPGHARTTHDLGEALVESIIPNDCETVLDESQLGWADELVDAKVDVMVRMINDGHVFNESMFLGGVTKSDVDRMRREAKQKREKKKVVGEGSSRGDGLLMADGDVQQSVELVATKVIDGLESNIENTDAKFDELKQLISCMKVEIREEICKKISGMEDNVVARLLESLGKGDKCSEYPDVNMEVNSASAQATYHHGFQCELSLRNNANEKDHMTIDEVSLQMNVGGSVGYANNVCTPVHVASASEVGETLERANEERNVEDETIRSLQGPQLQGSSTGVQVLQLMGIPIKLRSHSPTTPLSTYQSYL